MKDANRYLQIFWIQIRQGFFTDLAKLWPSAAFLAAVSTINALGLTKPILTLSQTNLEQGEWIIDMTTWYNGILILAALAWMLILGAHIVQAKEYHLVSNNGYNVDTFTGNANWVSGILIGLGLIVFLVLQTPIIPTLLITVLTVMFYAGRGRFHEQGEFELPKLANLVIVLLSVWQIAIG